MSEDKEYGFSWMGFLFGAVYYGGYGKYAKAVVMALIGFMPLTMIFVNIYAGVKAKKELPVGEMSFKWLPAIGILLFQMVLGVVAYAVINYDELIADGKFSDVSQEAQTVSTPEQVNALSVVDFVVDYDQYIGKQVQVVGVLVSMGSGFNFLYNDADLGVGVSLDISRVDRDTKKLILTNCDDGCSGVIVEGIVDRPYFDIELEKGITATSIYQ